MVRPRLTRSSRRAGSLPERPRDRRPSGSLLLPGRSCLRRMRLRTSRAGRRVPAAQPHPALRERPSEGSAPVVQSQNRDYADRAVDDARRLAIQDEAIERLESSVQAYQDERARLESAYHQLASSLGETEAQADASIEPGRHCPATRKKQALARSQRV